MKILISRLFLRLFFLTAFLLVISGCAQKMKSVQSEPLIEPSGNATIQSIQFSNDASTIEISTDRPIVYTYYMLDTPPRIIIDLAQTTSGALVLPIEVNKGIIKRVDVARHEFGTGVLSRVDITLTQKVEVTGFLDSNDKKKLILTLNMSNAAINQGTEKAPAAVPETAAAIAPENKEPVLAEKSVASALPAIEPIATPVVEPVVNSAAGQVEPNAGAKPEPSVKQRVSPPGSPRSLTAITAGAERIDIEVSAPVESFKAFKLSQPDRLVIDIAKTKNLIAAKQVEINKFNLGKARIGGTGENLRVVFDAAGGSIPPYHVLKYDYGLQILFSETTRKSSVAREQTPAEQAVPATVSSAASSEPPAAASGQPPAEQAAAASEAVPAEVRPATAPDTPALVSAPKAAESRPVSKPFPSSAAAGGTVETIEFNQVENLSQITVRTSGNCTAAQPVKSSKGVQLTLKGCRLPLNLQRPLVTTGFETAINEIAPYPLKTTKGDDTRIAVKMKNALPYTFKQEGTVWKLEFSEPVKPVKRTTAKTPKPAAAQAAPLAPVSTAVSESAGIEREFAEQKSESGKTNADEDFALSRVSRQMTGKPQKVYTGRKVSLEFSDADIRKIFQLIAEVSNQNFLIADDVSGTISLKLVNVPWDQALDVILESKGLGMQKDGNIVQIRPKTKMKSLDDEAIEMRITEEKKMPLSTVIFDINYASLSDIETQFKNLKSKRTDTSISSDVRTNKLIVVDIEPNIKKMKKLLEALDVPEKQVMIEARIVEASSSFARDIGVKWNYSYTDGSASVANINNITGSMGGIVSAVLPSTTTGGLATGVSFGKLLSNIQLDMRLSAAATVGQVKIISTPRILTVNNKPAKISQGQMIPYQNTSSTEGAKTEFIEAALTLDVTPHITADGSVNMKIKATNNSAGVGSPPPINKKEATTELVVKNGETTVIGGIYVDSETDGDTGIPYLQDIPLLGWLFKSNAKNKTKNELLIFITPKIMN